MPGADLTVIFSLHDLAASLQSTKAPGRFPWADAALASVDYLRRGLTHFKPGTHFLDLGGLVLELGCESLYLFLLLSDRCLQLLNFVVEHSLVFRVRGRLQSATRRWYGTLGHLQRRLSTSCARNSVPAKMVVCTV